MKPTHTLIIRRDGRIEFLAPPPFPLKLDRVKRERFSEIVPLDPVKRVAFRVLRKLFGERGKVAAWTRRWLCIWTGHILIGPHRGEEFISPFRQAVLDWEKEKFCEPRFNL
jgi:hypothetical protein